MRGSAQSTKLICWLHFCLFSRLFRKVSVLRRGKNRFLQSVFPVFLCCWGCFLVCTCLKEGDGPGLLPWFFFFPGLVGHLKKKIVQKVTLLGDKFANTRTTKWLIHFIFIFRLRLKWYKMWPKKSVCRTHALTLWLRCPNKIWGP